MVSSSSLMQSAFHASSALARKPKKDRGKASQLADVGEIAVSLRDNLVGDIGVTLFAQSLTHARIRWLDLTGNVLGEKGGAILGEWMRRSADLVHLVRAADEHTRRMSWVAVLLTGRWCGWLVHLAACCLRLCCLPPARRSLLAR